MRMTVLYSLAKLLPDLEIHILTQDHQRNIYRHLFADRIHLPDELTRPDYAYEAHWIKDKIRNRQKMIVPYFRLSYARTRHKTFKKRFRYLVFSILCLTGWIKAPSAKYNHTYSGYLQVCALDHFSSISYEQVVEQLKKDHPILRQKLHELHPPSPEPGVALLVFPGGSSHQQMPEHWAKEHLPHATFAIHSSNTCDELNKYQSLGLNTVTFTNTSELLKLMSNARQILSTDSFTSHLCQVYAPTSIIALTQQLPYLIINPAFEGTYIESQAPCCPCVDIGRFEGKLCMAGRVSCVTWENKIYNQTLLHTLKQNNALANV